jgi:hypothetical protein
MVGKMETPSMVTVEKQQSPTATARALYESVGFARLLTCRVRIAVAEGMVPLTREDFEIRLDVVTVIPVQVMDQFPRLEGSSDFLLGKDSIEPLAVAAEFIVPVAGS